MSKRKWSKYEDDLLIAEYPDSDLKEIAEKISRSISSIYNRANLLGLKRVDNRGYQNLIKHGVNHRFKKGNKPFNKGLKQYSYMNQESIEKTKATRFKKGNLPKNYKPIGSERIQVDGYVYVKVANPKKWRLKHHVLWEKLTGEKLDTSRFIITFKNKNKQDIRIENLEKIDRTTSMNRNTIHRYPEELKSTIRTLSKFKKVIHNAEK